MVPAPERLRSNEILEFLRQHLTSNSADFIHQSSWYYHIRQIRSIEMLLRFSSGCLSGMKSDSMFESL